MKRIGILLACGALTFGLTACDDDNGGIMLMDGGAGDDAGADPTPDAGPMPMPDSGPEQTCNVTATTSFPQLPEQCLPRCDQSTIGCIQNCGMNAACQNACLTNDPTPTIPFFINGMPDGNIDCGTCINWQQTYCLYQVCPAETEAAIACQQGGGSCDAEIEAVNTCTEVNDEEFGGCFDPLLFACFGA